tara:strand:+ start:1212 stop:1340 length:129 start_codon:yes stop_codon:yes gene_type:complete
MEDFTSEESFSNYIFWLKISMGVGAVFLTFLFYWLIEKLKIK